MSNLQYIQKITRPGQCLIAALAAWVVALLSNGPFWFSQQKLAAAAVIFFSVFGASLWHYGTRSDMYAKKHWDLVLVKNPSRVRNFGGVGFAASIIVAALYLPWPGILMALINTVIIVLYAKRLDQFWPWKNLVIALVCTTPLLVGWFSGHRLHPVVVPIIVSAFFIYLTREMLKDIEDRSANRGLRFTMVMQLGIPQSLRIAGLTLIAALIAMFYALQFVPQSTFFAVAAFWAGAYILIWYAIKLLKGIYAASNYKRLDIAVLMFIVCILVIRITLY